MPGFIHVHAGKFLKPIANETSLLLISTSFSFLFSVILFCHSSVTALALYSVTYTVTVPV